MTVDEYTMTACGVHDDRSLGHDDRSLGHNARRPRKAGRC